MQLALIQSDIVWNAPERNVERCRTLSASAIARGAQLLVFPEMFTTGFSFPKGAEATRAYECGVAFFAEICKAHGVYCCGTLPLRPQLSQGPEGEQRAYNSFVMLGPDGFLGQYSKIHLYSPDGEHLHALAGAATATFNIGGLRVSPVVCYDLRFPQLFAKLAPETDLFLVSANWPIQRASHWSTLLAARAIESQAYVAGVNRVGQAPHAEYVGGSRIISPKGELLALGGDREEIILACVSAEAIRNYRKEFPVLGDRRPELY